MERWNLHPALEVQARGECLTLLVRSLGVACPASNFEYGLLRCFEAPASVDEVLREHPFQVERARAFLERAAAMNLLLPVGDEGRVRLPDRVRADPPFLHAPALEVSPDAPFAILGVPLDRDVTGRGGARFGPAAIRDAVRGLRWTLDPHSLQPIGLHDYATGQRILEGVSLCDAGDVALPPGEPTAEAHRRITGVVRELLQQERVPIVFGGDHSILRPALEATRGVEGLWVVQLDAHSDLGALEPGQGLHHGNVIRAVLDDLPWVEGVVQLGLRGYLEANQVGSHARAHPSGMRALRAGGWREALRRIPAGAPRWLTLDIDVVDPAFAPSTGTPLPGGLLPHDLFEIVHEVARSGACIGCDIVEVAEPQGPADGTASIAASCAIEFMSGAWRAARDGTP